VVNRTRRAVTGHSGVARIARCRSSSTRSSARAARPRSQFLTVPRATPSARAITDFFSRATNRRAASTTRPTPEVFPGNASSGSTRSTCPQRGHSAERTCSWIGFPSCPATASLRLDQRLLQTRSDAPHLAQRQPANTDSGAVAATAR
jgi:hypothetical protein